MHDDGTIPQRLAVYAAQVDELLADRGRIVVGPWLGEVGWEVLYWIPFLRWTIRRWPALCGRLTVVSRGGVKHWYRGVASEYVDVFDRFAADEFVRGLSADRALRTDRGVNRLKQKSETTPFEEAILDRMGLTELPRLHPSVMFNNRRGVKRLLAWEAKRDRYERWRKPRRSRLRRVLPRTYVAVRFYTSRMFRGNQAERFAQDVVRAVSALIPVVDLSTAFETDPQHPDLDVGDDVVRLAPHMRFRGNLRDQSVAIANASAFVGVFGGTAFLAPHYGVPSHCFWSTTKLGDPSSGKGPWANLRLAERVYNGPGWGGFEASSCIDADADEVAARIVRRVG
jgi:hypothetical protein